MLWNQSVALLTKFLLLLVFIKTLNALNLKNRTLFAVNCGGPRVVGTFGIVYEEDTLTEGYASSRGKDFFFENADIKDFQLYQTQRWASDEFTYSVNISENGYYNLILKFSEVFFNSAGKRIFDVTINNQIGLLNYDIFSITKDMGLVADQIIPLKVFDGKLESPNFRINFFTSKLEIKFSKVHPYHNPTVNAIALVEGDASEIEKLFLERKSDRYVPNIIIKKKTEFLQNYLNEQNSYYEIEQVADNFEVWNTTVTENSTFQMYQEEEFEGVVIKIIATILIIVSLFFLNINN